MNEVVKPTPVFIRGGMDREDMICIHTMANFPAPKKEQICVVCRLMETAGNNHKKGIKSASGRQILCFLFYVALRFHSDT